MKKKTLIIIICIFNILLIFTSIIIILFGKNYLSDYFFSNQELLNYEENNKIELNYTEEQYLKSDGVYITDVSDVVEEVMPSIVAITSKTIINSGMYGPSFYGKSGSYTSEGAGSGVIITENDDELFILTNYHVVENATELSIKFIDEKSYDAKIKGISKRTDLAVVSVNKNSLEKETLSQIKIATLGNSNGLKVGNGIIAIGNALGYGQSVTTGVVSALNREITTDDYIQNMIQIDAAINGGNSGGALLNSKGQVVGINSLKYSMQATSSNASVEGIGFAIPITDVKNVIETLINGQDDKNTITLGIEGIMRNGGFYITSIKSGGNAENADLEIGNIITEIDKNKVTSSETIEKVLYKKNSGDSVSLKVKYIENNMYKEKDIIINLK